MLTISASVGAAVTDARPRRRLVRLRITLVFMVAVERGIDS